MEVKNITVLGAGTMGHGIAQAAASAGFHVTMYDVAAEFTEAGMTRIRKSLAKRVEKGKLAQEERDATMARLKTENDLPKAAENADFVIEAVPENIELKKEIFAELDRVC